MFIVILGCNLHKFEHDILQEGVGVSQKHKNDVIKDKIDS